MKREDIFKAIGDVDECFISESEPKLSRNRRTNPVFSFVSAHKSTVLACVLCLLIIIQMAVALSTYNDNDTPPLIGTDTVPPANSSEDTGKIEVSVDPEINDRLDEFFDKNDILLKEEEDIFKDNSAESLLAAPNGWGENEGVSDAVDDMGSDLTYHETVDNQHAGAIEADIVKASDKYIFYAWENTIAVISASGYSSTYVAKFSLTSHNENVIREFKRAHPNLDFKDVTVSAPVLHLSKDCSTLTAIYHLRLSYAIYYTCAVMLDVSDVNNIKQINDYTVSGYYITSREVGDKLLILTSVYAFKDNEYDFYPAVLDEELNTVAYERTVFYDEASDNRFSLLSLLSKDSLELIDTLSLFSHTAEAYVTDKHIYMTMPYLKSEKRLFYKRGEIYTKITRISFSDSGLLTEGSFDVAGYIRSSYNLDEKDNMLRVVTTTAWRNFPHSRLSSLVYKSIDKELHRSASIYALNIDTGNIVGSVEHFAPEGEDVRSVRFKDNVAYVCTAIEIIDPVFFFDLSDPENITYKQSPKFSGFSTSLVDFGNGLLLGIGTSGSDTQIKLELYREGENGVEIANTFIRNGIISEDYKSYFIDRENQLLGLGIYDFMAAEGGGYMRIGAYLLLKYDGEKWNEVILEAFDISGAPETKRGVLINGYFYMLAPHSLRFYGISAE